MQNRRRHRRAIDVLGTCALAFACVWTACENEQRAPQSSTAAGESGGQSAALEPRAGAEGGAGGDAGRSASAGRAGSTPAADASVPDAMASGTGGMSGSGVRAGSTPAADASMPASGPYACDAKLAANPTDPGGDGAEGSACCGGLGSCERRGTIVLDLEPALGRDSCKAGEGDDDLRCAPTALAHSGVCRAQTGGAELEGRCVPRCFVAGTPSALLLTTTDCGSDGTQVCGACFDPVTGQATGVCTLQDGDRPSEPAPVPYKECGVPAKAGGAAGGVCMPRSLAMASGNPVVASLPQDTCVVAEVCMPKLKAADFNACFKHCETSALVQAAGSIEGGCIPPYIAENSNPEAVVFLQQGACSAGELCAPCLDPTKDFRRSGACE